MTTLGELRTTYALVHKDFNMKKYNLSVQKNKLEERIKNTENGQQIWGEQAATLELQYNAVSEKQKEYDDFIKQYMKLWDEKFEETAIKQNAEATEDYYEDMNKIMLVAMRMCRGDKVPLSDEKKLMEAEPDLYLKAKNAQMMMRNSKSKEYDSLWEEEEKKEYENPIDVADAVETNLSGPEIVSADSVAEAAVASE
ncbi:MAG: hypothetical protein PUE21_06010 [Lachnospiraceae bacterium]|nr:hypothetical protein [Lachnospiraceae bacterium]